MKNKDFLRRAAAFAVSLSFISYSGMIEIINMEAEGNGNVTPAVASSTTAPVTSAAPENITDNDYNDYKVEIDKNVGREQRAKIADNIFGHDNITISEIQDEPNNFSVKKGIKGAKSKTLKDFLSGNSNVKYIKKDGEVESQYIIADDQCYYISGFDDNSIKLELCLYLVIDKDIDVSYNAENGEMILDDKFKIYTVAKFNYTDKNDSKKTVDQFCVRSNQEIKCSVIDEWKIREDDCNISVNIKPENNVDNYISIKYSRSDDHEKDINFSINKITKKEDGNTTSTSTSTLKTICIKEKAFKYTVNWISDKEIPLNINERSLSKSSDLYWSESKKLYFKIKEGYTYDVYINQNKKINDSSDNETLNFESDDLKEFLNQEDTDINIYIRPVSVDINVMWENTYCPSVYNNIKEKFNVVNSEILFPYLKRKDGATYYLSKIEFNNKQPIEINIQNFQDYIQNGKSNEKINYYNNDIKSVVYSKINRDDNNLISYNSDPVKRNLKCYSIKSVEGNNIYLLGGDNDTKTYKNIFLFYRTIQQGKYVDMWYNCEKGFYVTKNSRFIQIISFVEINNNNEVITMKEIKLNEPENLYIDTVGPKVSKVTIDSENLKKIDKTDKDAPEYWSNNTYDFSVFISDADEQLKEFKEVNDIVNTLSDDYSEISSVQIGEYTFKYIDGKWINTNVLNTPPYNVLNTPPYTVSISKVEKNESEGGFYFYISVALNEQNGVRFFKDSIEVTATDNCGNESNGLTVNINIDKVPPVLQSMEVETIVKNAKGNMAVNTITKEDGKKIAGVNVKAEINDKLNSEDGSGIKKVTAEYINSTYKDKNIASECEFEFKDGEYTAYLGTSQNNNNDITNSVGIIKITAEDNVGNISEFYYRNNTDNNNKPDYTQKESAQNIIFDTTNPECSISLPNNGYIENSGSNSEKNWYKSLDMISLPITAKDVNENICSGLNILKFNINNEPTINIANIVGKGITTDKLKKGMCSVKFSLNDTSISASLTDGTVLVPLIEEIKQNPENSYKVSISAFDYSGNGSEHELPLAEKTFYIDDTIPEIDGFEFEDGIVRQWKDITSGKTGLNPFAFFNNNDAVVTVYAKDDNPSSGIKVIHVDLINLDGSICKDYEEKVFKKDKDQSGRYSKRFNIPEGFKGTIEAYAIDNVNNKSDTKSPNGYVSENGGRHISTSGAHITLPSTEYKDISTQSLPLYTGDVTSKIYVNDSYSGISKVEWNTSDLKNDEWHQINIDSSGNIYGDGASEWKIISTDRNLVTALERDITVSANMNNDHIFVRTTDNSGNVSQTEEHFSIDKTIPAIELKWNNTTDNNYYNADRTVSVLVNERNFNGADIKINDRSQALDFKLVSGAQTEGTDNAVYGAEYTFSSDGEFELSADCTDMCSNKAMNVKSGKFIIDKTKPVVSVSFTDTAGNPVNPTNSKYYSSAVNAVITVTETNFNGSLVALNINGEKKTDCSWRDNGNVHTTTVPFNNEGEYQLIINGSDIAGNKFDGYSYSFCIDKENPSIEFGKKYDVQSGTFTEGMRPADNSSEISPVIVINDKNLNPDNITIKLQSSIHDQDVVLVSKGNVKNDEYVDTNECYYDSKSGKYVISLYDIQDDDIYDLTVDAYDMSGNKGVVGSGKSKYLNKTDSGIKFSVNRNGSTFELAEDTASNVNKKYLQEPKNVSIREINVNEHSDDPDILIHKDIENQADPDVEFEKNELDGYVEYIYALPQTNFKDLAKYSVDILSSDIAGNKNSSSAVKESNSEDFLSFWVDSEQPDCSLLNVKSGEEYSEAQMQCRVQITDNIEVDGDSIKIILDGNEVDYKLIDTNVYAFNIDASNKERTIQVNCNDMAHNTINKTVAEHFMVSKNPFAIFFHKKIVKLLTAVIGGTAIISGAAITIFRRKRRIK